MVPLHARFCSECGTWVVHELTGTEAPMPPPPPVQMPAPADTAVQYAGTLPASSALLQAVTASAVMPKMSVREPPEPALPPPPASPRLKPPSATMMRTLNSGEVPSVQGTGTAAVVPVIAPERTVSRANKTIADERPSVAPSVSLGRPPRPLGAFLVSYQYEPLGTFWPLGLGANLIGRAGAGRPDLDVGISDTTVSSEQALIEVDARGITVEDRASRNGTSLNGRPLPAGAKVAVSHGDRIKFGSFETILVQVPYPAGP